jgi:hypothetical protein
MQCGYGHYVRLMQRLDTVIDVFLSLEPRFQEVIADITQRMGEGMAEFIQRDVSLVKVKLSSTQSGRYTVLVALPRQQLCPAAPALDCFYSATAGLSDPEQVSSGGNRHANGKSNASYKGQKHFASGGADMCSWLGSRIDAPELFKLGLLLL